MKKSVLKLKISPSDYNGLLNLAGQVKALMTANVALYPTPNPTLVQLTTHITAANMTLAKWSMPNNRGSHADLVALKVAATDVRNDLLLLAAYVNNTVDNTLPPDVQLANLLASGFTVKSVHSKIPLNTPAKSIHRLIKKNVTEPNVKLKWIKPQQLLTGSAPRTYNIYKNGVLTGSTTRTSMIVVRPAGAVADEYTIKALTDLGEGEPFKFEVAAKGA